MFDGSWSHPHSVLAGALVLLAGCSSTGPAAVQPRPLLTTTQVAVSGRPFGAAVSSTGTILVTQQDADALTQIPLRSLDPVGVVSVGRDPGDVVFSGDGAVAYVTNFIAGTVGFVNLATRQMMHTVTLGGEAWRLRLSPNGRRLYVTVGSGALCIIDVAARAIVATIPIDPNSNGVALQGDSILYVSSTAMARVAVVDLRTRQVRRYIDIGGTPQDIALSRDGRELYVANEGGALDIVSLSTNAVTGSLPLEGGAFGLALSPDGFFLYVGLTTGRVIVLDRSTREVVGSVNVGGLPRRIAFDPKGQAAVVPNEAGWADVLR